jgi:hypothetical protein
MFLLNIRQGTQDEMARQYELLCHCEAKSKLYDSDGLMSPQVISGQPLSAKSGGGLLVFRPRLKPRRQKPT